MEEGGRQVVPTIPKHGFLVFLEIQTEIQMILLPKLLYLLSFANKNFG